MRVVAPLALLVLLALLVAPVAAAELRMSVAEPGSELAANGSLVHATVVTLDCRDIALAGVAQQQAVVALEATMDSEQVLVAMPESVAVPLGPCTMDPTGNTSAEFDVVVSATFAAPGEQKIGGTVDATLARAQGMPPLEASADFDVVVKPFFRLAVKVDQSIVDIKGEGKAMATLTVTNLGNTRATIELRETDGNVLVHVPSQIVLESAAQGGGLLEQAVAITMKSPQGRWSQYISTIEVVSASTKDPSLRGEPLVVNLLVRNADLTERGTPAPGLVLLAPALLVGALLARRRP